MRNAIVLTLLLAFIALVVGGFIVRTDGLTGTSAVERRYTGVVVSAGAGQAPESPAGGGGATGAQPGDEGSGSNSSGGGTAPDENTQPGDAPSSTFLRGTLQSADRKEVAATAQCSPVDSPTG